MFTTPGDPVPTGIRGDQTVTVMEGGVVGHNFTAGWGSTVNVIGGEVGANFEASGALVRIEGGTVAHGMGALPGSKLFISGGSVGAGLYAFTGSNVMITGGSIGDTFQAFSGSNVIISGGAIGDGFNAEPGSNVTITGGTLGDDIQAEVNSTVNIVGTQFTLNGVDFTASLAMSTPWEVTQRDVTLAGVLADGTPFSFELDSVPKVDQGSIQVFEPDALLTVTRVLPGDFNADAAVDAADYVVWRRGLGTIYSQAHYDVWRANFGLAAGGGAAAALAAVPEPATLVLLWASLCTSYGWRRDARHSLMPARRRKKACSRA
jgi:hypothetical protein